jgi:DNA-binding NarL/FixJ family response regulator
MTCSLLILDDEAQGAKNLARTLSDTFPEYRIQRASAEDEMRTAVTEWYYNIAIVDLRMDAYAFNGLDLIRDITALSPHVFLIVISAFTAEFSAELNELLGTGRVRAVVQKDDYAMFSRQVEAAVRRIVATEFADGDAHASHLSYLYAAAKSEPNPQSKGVKFETFVANLFGLLGFSRIIKRTRDQSMNEVDLLIRNELADPLFAKLGPYILVECKNEKVDVDKNVFIVFKTKLAHTAGLASFGIIVTAQAFKSTAYKEALRDSGAAPKVLFLGHRELTTLIEAPNRLEAFKQILDSQVKDN